MRDKLSVVPKGSKRVRYYGVQAAKSFAKLKPMIQAALAQAQHVIRGAVKIIAPMTYRQRYHQSMGRDPLRCLRTVRAANDPHLFIYGSGGSGRTRYRGAERIMRYIDVRSLRW